MAIITIRDLHVDRTLDRTAMTRLRGAGGGDWVVGWIAPFTARSSSSQAGNIFNVTNNIFNQFITANQATFQNQTTEVFNSGANAAISVGTSQASAATQH